MPVTLVQLKEQFVGSPFSSLPSAITSPSWTATVDIVSSILALMTCKVCGEGRPMSSSVMEDAHEQEFDWVGLELAVKLSCAKNSEPECFGLDTVGLTFR